MQYIEKTTDLSDKKKLKKYLRKCIRYSNLPWDSRIIDILNPVLLIAAIAAVAILGIAAYVEKESGILRSTIYKSSYFLVIAYFVIGVCVLGLYGYLRYRWLKKHYLKKENFKLFIFQDGIEYYDEDSQDEPTEISFRDMKDLKTYENCIIYTVLSERGKRIYECVYVPAFTLSSSERYKIHLWYRQQKKSTTSKKTQKWKGILIGILLILFIVWIAVYSYQTIMKELTADKLVKIEGEIDWIPEKENTAEEIIPETDEVQQSGLSTDEERLMNEINKRKIYRDQCSFYGEVSSYLENVRGVRDIGSMMEPIYRTNEIYYTKENFQNDPPLIIYLAINEIYARHGYQFKNADLDNYFRGMVWYEPVYTAEEFDTSVFNDCEQQNLQILRELDTYERD